MNPNYSETYSLSAVGEHCPGSLRRGLVKTSSSLLLMQLSDKLLTLDLCICFDWFNMMRATAVASTLPNTKCFLLTKYYERYCSLCRPLVQMEHISSRKVVLIMSFLSIVILSPAWGEWKFHTRFLSLVPSVESQQKHILQDLSQLFKSAEILVDGVRPLEKTC